MEDKDIKRLFFALEVSAPWPQSYPKGRLLKEEDRHLTIAFLGDTDFIQVKSQLDDLPIGLRVGSAGYFNKVLLLPPKHPRVVAWHANLLYDSDRIEAFYQSFIEWLAQHELPPSHPHRHFLPHTTICRGPFPIPLWKKHFTPIPFTFSKLHLYESVGNLRYEPRWTHHLMPPFEEIEHTADIAFLVRGENLLHLFQNAMMAMAFHDSKYLQYFDYQDVSSLNDIVIQLNEAITKYDTEEGAPHKAVSFHGNIEEKNGYLEWEMVIDV